MLMPQDVLVPGAALTNSCFCLEISSTGILKPLYPRKPKRNKLFKGIAWVEGTEPAEPLKFPHLDKGP